jgi:hypothetical protein
MVGFAQKRFALPGNAPKLTRRELAPCDFR